MVRSLVFCADFNFGLRRCGNPGGPSESYARSLRLARGGAFSRQKQSNLGKGVGAVISALRWQCPETALAPLRSRRASRNSPSVSLWQLCVAGLQLLTLPSGRTFWCTTARLCLRATFRYSTAWVVDDRRKCTNRYQRMHSHSRCFFFHTLIVINKFLGAMQAVHGNESAPNSTLPCCHPSTGHLHHLPSAPGPVPHGTRALRWRDATTAGRLRHISQLRVLDPHWDLPQPSRAGPYPGAARKRQLPTNAGRREDAVRAGW